MNGSGQSIGIAVPGVLPSPRALMDALLLAGVCFLPVLLYIPFTEEPFLRDEGLFATTGQIVLDGGIPYRDAFDNKPPLIFGWYALSFLLFGETVWAPRLLVSLLLSITTLLVYVQGTLMFTRGAGLIGATAFAVSTGFAAFETNANVEYFMLLPMVGALVSFTMGEKTGRFTWFVLAGLLSGFAIFTKQTAVFNLAFLTLLPVMSAVRANGRAFWKSPELPRKMGALVIGCAIAAGLVIAPFLFTGTFPEFFDAVVLYSNEYVGTVSPFTKIWLMVRAPVLLALVTGPFMVLAGLGAWKMRESGHPYALLAIGWLISSVVAIAIAGRFYQHYFVMLLPGLALLIPPGIGFLRESWERVPARAVTFALLPLVGAVALIINGTIYVQPTPEERHLQKYLIHPMARWEVQSPRLGAWLKERTSEEDLIYNLGFQSEVYFYADRRPASRLMFDHPFAVRPELEEEAIEHLREEKPLYIFDSAIYEPEDWLANSYSHRVKQFINEEYDYIGKVFYADMYRLRQ